jgi:hypothetical protein
MTWGYGDAPALSIKWSLALCHHARFRGERLISAVALMWAESGRYPEAWHQNTDDDGKVTSTDRGLFQINDKWHPALTDAEAYKPIPNAEYASKISHRGQHFGPWAAYPGPRYLAFYPIVAVVWATGTWRSRIDGVERKFGT